MIVISFSALNPQHKSVRKEYVQCMANGGPSAINWDFCPILPSKPEILSIRKCGNHLRDGRSFVVKPDISR
jgi:hypothetical protein